MTDRTYHPSLRIIHENNFGFIGKCPCCGDVQFCLGNVVSFMPEVDFLKLYHSFKKINRRLGDSLLIMPNGKKIMVRTPVDNFLLSLSIPEFHQVMDLFSRMSTNLQLVESLEKIENLN